MKRIDYLRQQIEHLRQHPTDECVEWPYAKDTEGYGLISSAWDFRTSAVHRIAFELFHGTRPRLLVLHKCDQPSCYNPTHLFEGTNKENSIDMIRKNRHINHSQNPMSYEQGVEAVRLLAEGLTCAEVADRLNVRPVTIYFIEHGRTWRHIPRH